MLDVQQVLYTLKRDYGAPVALYKRGPETVDLQTGKQVITETKYGVHRAVVLPLNVFLKYFRLLGSTDFGYGGDLSVEQRIFIIDRRDLPRSLEVTSEMFVIYDHRRFSVALMTDYDVRECYYLTGKLVTGTDVAEQIDASVQSWVYVTDAVGVVPS